MTSEPTTIETRRITGRPLAGELPAATVMYCCANCGRVILPATREIAAEAAIVCKKCGTKNLIG